MGAEVKRIEVLKLKLEPKPGALAKVFSALRDAKVNVAASWGYQMEPGEAEATLYASDTAKAKQTLEKLGVKPELQRACYAEGSDAIGSYHDLLKKIADAGVNLEASDAFGIGGKFATVFFASAQDFDKLCKALGC